MAVWACGSKLAVAAGGAARAGRGWGLAAWRRTTPGFRGRWTTTATTQKEARRFISDAKGSRSSAEHNIVSSHVPDVPLPSGNAAAYVLETAKEWPNRTALECSLTGRSYTYGQLVDAVARWGGQLLRLGLRRGDTLAVMMLNCPEYPVVVLGALSVGMSYTGINPAYTAEEVRRQLQDSGASLVVHDNHTGKVVEVALALLKKPLPRILNTDSSPPAGVVSLRGLLQDSAVAFVDPVEVSGKEVALLPYSSGTMGKPKGVEVSHGAVSSNVAMYTHPSFFPPTARPESQHETFLCFLPFYHVYGLLPIMSSGLRKGVKIVTVPKFEPDAFVPLIMKHKVSFLHTVPPVLNFLMQSPAVTPESMASVWYALCGAAPVSQTAAQALKEKMDKPMIFQEGYGMTEALITHITPLSSTNLSLKTLPNVKMKVVDMDTQEALPANQEGEICFLTPSRMNGYINNEAATRDTIDEEGWVHSGDIGLYDEDGGFRIVDRAKDLIKVKGLQVAPSELEEELLQHPKVREVGVVGIPHDRLGEAPRAFVVTSSPATEKEIQEFLATRLAPHKQLAGGVVFISELPKNPTGKILRRQLRQLG
ncbi:uncharacterized protein LOC126999811 isoform X5 [Eriocheir sinensis]|uniref:uncharacterized protein LOC126999811 isoform X4 n=1 Tax=Eriocheir sinensis TaxID=95602 RepID=UPI0021C7EE7A|nr:uncharacterized protein LOC126999811 isoform X4 [Eriocheir sinensis]XP_050718768.1 uncharacterized protein LOC126999811 isoform X5 [Eriocheir sinensis]